MIPLLGGGRQVPGSPISWHYTWKAPWEFPVAQLFRLKQHLPPFPTLCWAAEGGCHWPRIPEQENATRLPGLFQAAGQWQRQNNVWGRIYQVYPAGQGSARARQGWPGLGPRNVQHLWRELSRTRARMPAGRWLLLRLGQGKVCARLQCWNS